MERQPLAGVEADDEAPFLPAHLVAVDLEARPLRLGDLQRLDVGAEIGTRVGGVVPLLRRQRPVAVFLDADHLHRVQIDDGPQPSIGRA
jgi:hypothetical protein